jgi:hypothetical protein
MIKDFNSGLVDLQVLARLGWKAFSSESASSIKSEAGLLPIRTRFISYSSGLQKFQDRCGGFVGSHKVRLKRMSSEGFLPSD